MSQIHTLSRPYRRYHLNDYAASSTVPITPSLYPLLAWFRASDLALSDNASVSSWASAAGTIVASGGTSPTYKTIAGPGGKPSVLWSGGQSLNLSPTLNLTTANWTVAAVVLSNSDGMILGQSGHNFQMRKLRSGANTISVYDSNTDISSNTFSTVPTNAVLCWWVYSSGAISFYENQTARGGPTSWATYSSNLDEMGRTNFGGNWSGYISEICAWNVTLAGAQISSLYTNYFSLRYGGVF